jgi:hypothetical protein
MKKTIAILLVLVIGMAGVFAATDPAAADLHIKTTVDAINQMAVIKADDTTFSWDDIATLDGGLSNEVYATSATAYTISSDLSDTTIAILKARSNHRDGVALSLDATPLASVLASVKDSENIDYTVEVGSASINFVDGAKTITASGIGSLAYVDVVAEDDWNVNLTLDESLADAAADTYTANLTFTFTAN